MVMADDYTGIWNNINKARQNDLPATQIELLDKLIAKAEKEASYGNLMKAVKERIEVRYSISPDSFLIDIERLEKYTENVDKSSVVYSVYNSLLGSLYKEKASEYYNDRTERARLLDKASIFFKKSLLNTEASANVKTKELYPFFSKKSGYDLLISLAYNAMMFEEARDYYLKKGNRRNALLMSLEVVRKNKNNSQNYLSSLDSLISRYGDIDACCEVAIAKYECLNNNSSVSVKDKISFVRESLKRWGGWHRASELKNAELVMTRPSFKVILSKTQIADNEKLEISLKNVRNVKNIITKVWKTNLTTGDIIRHNDKRKSDDDFFKGIIKSLESKGCREFKNIFNSPDYEYSDKSFNIGSLDKGIYIIETTSSVKSIKPVYNLLYVSNLYVLSESLPENKTRIAVVDIISGQPVKNASVKLFGWNRFENNKEKEMSADDNGEIILSDNKQAYITYAFTNDDHFMSSTRINRSFGFRDNTSSRSTSAILTDRAIYRPGQTVKVAVVTYRNIKGRDLKVEGGKEITLTLKDANYKAIAQKKIKTDEYGSGSTEFVLPSRTLNGRFHISDSNSGFATFSVEEYKRPTFEINLSKPEHEYHLGDTINICGVANSFAGVPVQGAYVKYKIKRAWYPWLRYYALSSNDIVSEGKTITSSEGKFNVNVPLTIINEKNTGCYYFTIEADVTDAAGETRNGILSLPVSNKEIWFDCDIPEKIEKSEAGTIKFSLKNIAGTDIEGSVNFRIDGAVQQTVKANEEIPFSNIIKNISSGKHKLTAYVMGEEIEKDFIIFSLHDKVPATQTDEWFYITSETFKQDGESVTMQIGSSNENVHVLYSVVSGNKLIKAGTFKLNNEIKAFDFKYNEEYGNGIVINYAWIKNGKLTSRNVSIKKALPQKKLNLKWITFRNRLTPGEKELWTLQVSNTDGSKADASLTATLYDMALDNIIPHTWNRIYGLYTNVPFINWIGTGNNDSQYDYVQSDLNWFEDKESMFEKFPQIDLYFNQKLKGYDALMMPKTRLVSNNIQYSDSSYDVMEKSAEGAMKETSLENTAKETPQLRENLSETAFFYPSLTTDNNGKVNLSFTLPESITTWKFMAFAHDKKMQNEVFTDEIVAQKDVMIQPAMPRFFRKGDNATISARIFNLTERFIIGKAVMQIYNAETEELLSEKNSEFKIEENGTASVSFSYEADTDCDILICRIFAKGNNFSDGEQHYINVLSDKEMVTSTRVITKTEAEDFKVNADDMFGKDASDCHLTLEYTENPSWFVIQALPTVAENNRNDAVSAATQIYANNIARYIASSSKDIKKVIDIWNIRDKDKSLTSNLYKNAELKEIALNETPWVMEAANENMQKQRIAELFDENIINGRISSATNKLKSAQHDDGSWGWWPGMQGNRYITATIAEMLVRLEVMTGNVTSLKSVTDNAMRYLSTAAQERVRDLKKNEKISLSQSDLKYLYLKALRNEKSNDTDKWLIKELEKTNISGLNIYEKCLSAIIFAKAGNIDKAKQLIRSIKEYSVYTESMGRYFDTNSAGYSWCDYKIPTEVMAIEAINTVTPDDKETISEMQQWLLQEKRTTSWNTPINSVNAIYAFSNIGDKKYSTEVNDIVKINDIRLKQAEAGTGYVKASERGNNFDISVSKKNSGTSWLSLYATYSSENKDIEDSFTGIKINREIITDNKNDIKVGNRIKVRITVSADRDYDFVQITDKRAACMEPVNQISGYNGRYYCSMKDNAAYYYFDILPKGSHVIETEYYVDRPGSYATGTCKVQCAYAPEFNGITKSTTITVK